MIPSFWQWFRSATSGRVSCTAGFMNLALYCTSSELRFSRPMRIDRGAIDIPVPGGKKWKWRKICLEFISAVPYSSLIVCVTATTWLLLYGNLAYAYGGWYTSTSAAQAACEADLATFLPTYPSSRCTGISGSLDAQCAPLPRGPHFSLNLNVCLNDWQFCGGGWAYRSCEIGVQCPTGQSYNFEAQQCQPEKDLGNKCDAAVSNPCNAATGNKYQEEEDVRAGQGVPSFTRYYNSQLMR
jgi:hypothetical protein